MGKALEIITGQVTNPSTTITALTANAGNSFTVRNSTDGVPVSLLQLWAFTATAGIVRLRSPLMHDIAQNMRPQTVASIPNPLLSAASPEVLYPQDTLTFEMTGDAAAVDLASLLVYYDDLPGINAVLHAPAEVMPLMEHMTTVEVDLTSSATSCNYSAQVALNGTFDTLKRNRSYAILGYSCGTSGGTLGITGSATGNLRVGGPLLNRINTTAEWFVDLSTMTGKPCIPVFNSADVANVLLDCACQAASTSFKVGVNLALLKTNLA